MLGLTREESLTVRGPGWVSSGVLAGVTSVHLVFLRFLAHVRAASSAAPSVGLRPWPQVLCPLETHHGPAQRRGWVAAEFGRIL